VARLVDLAKAYKRAQEAVPAAERAAAERIKKAKEARAAAREALADGIVDAHRAGIPQTEIAAQAGYGREQVRRILRARGIEAD